MDAHSFELIATPGAASTRQSQRSSGCALPVAPAAHRAFRFMPPALHMPKSDLECSPGHVLAIHRGGVARHTVFKLILVRDSIGTLPHNPKLIAGIRVSLVAEQSAMLHY